MKTLHEAEEDEEPKKKLVSAMTTKTNGYSLLTTEEEAEAEEEDSYNKKAGAEVKYKECRKNHAASIGKYAVDGCCEFMPSGEDGTPAAFRCAACSCHRNFHRRSEIQISVICSSCDHHSSSISVPPS